MQQKSLQFTLFFALSLLFIEGLSAQCGTSQYQPLTANQIKATFPNAGDLFATPDNDGGFTVPYLPGFPEVHTLFAGGIILGGLDESGALALTYTTYRSDNLSNQFGSGPIDDQTGQPVEDDCYCENYDRIWVVQRYDIVSLIADYDDNNVIDNPIPLNIQMWPGRGNPLFEDLMGFSLPDQELAPFFDRNNNGLYEPGNGEYPIIGEDLANVIPDQMLWMVFNDVDIHLMPFVPPLGVEVQLMAYGFNCSDNPLLSQSIFTRHKIIKKAGSSLEDMIFGFWFDPDIGCYVDDYIGTDPVSNSMYAYNMDEVDGLSGCSCPGGVNTYCEEPPAQAITILNQTLAKSMVFSNGGVGNPPPGTTEPETPSEIYNYLNGRWRDGTPLTQGGTGYNPNSTEEVDHIFPVDPNDADGWSMLSENLEEGDRRMIFSLPPQSFAVGESITTDMAYSFYKENGADHLENVSFFLDNISTLQEMYDNKFTSVCTQAEICVEDCVWPGDANGNGSVEKEDVLAIGVSRGNQATGATRNPSSFDWFPQLADNWTGNFADGINFKHSDCNGDGQTTPIDLEITKQNYGLNVPGYVAPVDQPAPDVSPGLCFIYNKDTVSQNTSALHRLVRTEVVLGSENDPVDNIYGIAFNILYDTAMMEPHLGFPVIEIENQTLFGNQFETVSIDKPYPGRIDVAISKLNGQNVSGWSILAQMFLKLKSTATTTNPDGIAEIYYDVVNIRAIDSDENAIEIGAKRGLIVATDVQVEGVVKTEEPRVKHYQMSVSPTPSSGELFVDIGDRQLIGNKKLSVYNFQGNLLWEKEFARANDRLQIALPESLENGAYVLKLMDESGYVGIAKFVLVR